MIEIDACAKTSARAGENNRPSRIFIPQVIKDVDNLLAHIDRVCIQLVWSVQRDSRNAVGDIEQNVLVHE
jgi:hypothetical protein